jgi:hypothetical protein
MAHLKLTGVSDDGKRLLLMSNRGVEFTLDITPALRAALDGDTSGLGQVENHMDSVLRPRDIQARVRAGHSPEEVAQAAQTSIERVLVYARPVLAEREHVAQTAQKSSLGEAVTAHLYSLNLPPETVEWDAWRREDGRWSLIGLYTTSQREGSAEFTYDQPGNFVLLDNDDARWLIGEEVEPEEVPAPSTPAGEPVRRLSAVPAPDDGDDDFAYELPFDIAAEEASGHETAEVPAVDESVPGPSDEQDFDEDTEEPSEPPTPPARRAVQKKRGRASVPSWDEIMIGGGDQ